jgi:hypothetical protein
LHNDLSSCSAPNLLQSFALSKETGLFTAKDKDNSFFAIFDKGNLTHARLDQEKGYDAVIDFVVNWSEGTTDFEEDITASSAVDAKGKSIFNSHCAIKVPLDCMLMDAGNLYNERKKKP